jgi:hypothetical protein
MTPLAKPALGQAYKDPQFGTTIRRITAVPVTEGEGAVIKPMYSTMQAWNADESKLILWHREHGHELYDGRTYQFLRSLPISPTDIEHVLWDPQDPDVFYYPTNYNAIPNLMRYRVSTNSVEIIRNFQSPPTNCPVDWAKLLQLGRDPQYMSWGPEKIVGLQCGPTKFIYSIASNSVLSVGSVPSTDNAPIATPSGSLAFLDGYILDVRLQYKFTLPLKNPFEHASIGRSASGDDTFNTVAFDDSENENGTLVTINLSTAVKKVIVGPSTGYPYPPSSTHVSAIATKNPGWVAVSIVGDPTGAGLLDQELILGNADTAAVCRIGHHRSVAGVVSGTRWGYWSEPHNVISPSGSRVLFGSDWGNGPSVDSYVVELPSYH